jgi:hypothetical protein
MTLFLIGTSHRFQKGLRFAPEGCYDEFKEMLSAATQSHSVKTIAEEMSEEALGSDTVSLCSEVAEALAISHVFCDPSKAERVTAGLPVEDCLATWGQRELEWVARLRGQRFPVLFVCGANHVDSFAERCRTQGIDVVVMQEDWEPSKAIPLPYQLL